jgi:hypothetical protein
MTQRGKSPIKDKPLRAPGQSLDEQRFDLFYDKQLAPFFVALMLVMIAALEWWRYFHQAPPSPVLFTAFALFAAGYTALQFWRLRPRLRQLRLAAEGEKAVGQYLERLRESGYQVFHDVMGTGFNVDHVIIGPGGVFTIETKTRSKPAKSDARVEFDGERITVAGIEPDRDAIVQAKAQANWLRQLLAESTGRQLKVRPVILFPGWFVTQSRGSMRDVWVLEPKALPGFLGNEPPILKDEEIRLASFHLSRFIRVEEQRRSRTG